jgi:hypothetical protein
VENRLLNGLPLEAYGLPDDPPQLRRSQHVQEIRAMTPVNLFDKSGRVTIQA